MSYGTIQMEGEVIRLDVFEGDSNVQTSWGKYKESAESFVIRNLEDICELENEIEIMDGIFVIADGTLRGA